MQKASLKIGLILCVLLGMFAFQASAQEATILGTVTDPSGAAIPNAAVTTTNIETNQVSHFTTSGEGLYLAPSLQIGHYIVRVEAAGFKKAEQKDIALAVGDRARVDFKLEIGTGIESVTVEATPVAVQTETGEVSDVITSAQVTQLAVNGRSIYGLTALVAGASSNMPDVNTPTAVGGNATVSYNGNRNSHNIYMIDGGEDLDRGGSGTISVMPSIDSVGEFRTLTSNYSPDFGLSAGATFTMVFKSGTRDLHAAAWEFVRNEDLDANTFFNNRSGVARNLDRYNVYGFNVGGPVYIPKVFNTKRDKTFFFYNMEWRKIVSSGGLNTTVPSTSEYGGAFSPSLANTSLHTPCTNQVSAAIAAQFASAGQALSTPNSKGNCAIDPTLSGSQQAVLVPFTNNRIPTSLLDPNAQALLKAGIFPAPNNGTQFVGGGVAPTNVREEIVRVDHHFGDKMWVFGHFLADSIAQTYATTMWSGDNVPSAGNTFGNPSYSGVVHSSYVISPTLLNELAFNYNGNRINILPDSTALGVLDRTKDGVNIPLLFPNTTNLDNRIPGISLSQLGTNYALNWVPWTNKADDYQIRDDFSVTKGAHQLKFGVSWAIYKKIQTYFADTQGNFTFNGNYTGNDMADFLLGMASGYSEDGYQGDGHWDNQSWAVYAEDNWKVSRNLTLNLGLRWDGIPHTYEESNQQSGFLPSQWVAANAATLCTGGSSICPNSPGLGVSPIPALAGTPMYLNGIGIAGQNGVPRGIVQNYWHNFGPRIGFAYDPKGDGKTVVRGGFGIMYDRMEGNEQYNAATNVPFGATVGFSNVSLSNPGVSILTGQKVTAPIPITGITACSPTEYQPPESIQYNLGVQRELARNTVLSVAYVGTLQRHQNEYTDINVPNQSLLAQLIQGTLTYNTVLPYSGFGGIRLGTNDENGHYNSLQMTLRSQVRKDITLEAAYTLSKAYDPTNGGGGVGDLNNLSNPYNRAYDNGPSPLDRRDVFVMDFIYDLPILRGNSGTRLLRATLGGWQLSGIVTAETGFPLYLSLGGSQGSNGLANGSNRPNVSGNVSQPHSFNEWFDPSAFSAPAVGQWGDYARNSIYGPGRDNWNIALFKNFTLSEKRGSRFELRLESFNTFNHTQWSGIGTTFANTSQFGQVTGTYNPRNIQLGGKLMF
ncbi:MAG: TonB-dependent receptor [Bryobacteraceae bacterium]